MTSSENVINAIDRTEIGSAAARRLRKGEGKIPAVVYGLGKETLKIAIDKKEWRALNSDIQVIKVKVGKKRALNALVKDVQHDYLADTTLHIDLLEIDMNEAIIATVSVHSHGTPAGTSEGGILTQVLHEVEVSCLPDALPESIEVEVAELGMDEAIYVKDLILPEKVEVLTDSETLVMHVALPKIQEEPEEAEGEETEGEEGEEAEGEESKDAEEKDAVEDKKDSNE